MANESRWSLLLKPWWHVEMVRWLRRLDFDPPPSADCVALWMARRDPPLIADPERGAYRDFVKTAFGRGGHTLSRDLRVAFTDRQIGRLGRNLRFSPNARVSSLTFDQWLSLYRFAARTVVS